MTEKIHTSELPPHLSHEKRKLLLLEKEGKYVFHGTGIDVGTLVPQQAVDTETGPDGKPAVFASNKAEYAIFMAVINKYTCNGSSFSRSGATQTAGKEPVLHFGVSKKTMERLQENASGWVYVFDKSDFQSHPTKEGVEFVAHVPITPMQKIQVSRRDLPAGVTVFED